MRAAGLATFEKRQRDRSLLLRTGHYAGLGPDEAIFKKNRKAWDFFQSQPPYYRKTAGWWVMSAKKEETRQRRLKTLISDSAAARRIGPLTPKK
jgi:hypothetical protein